MGAGDAVSAAGGDVHRADVIGEKSPGHVELLESVGVTKVHTFEPGPMSCTMQV